MKFFFSTLSTPGYMWWNTLGLLLDSLFYSRGWCYRKSCWKLWFCICNALQISICILQTLKKNVRSLWWYSEVIRRRCLYVISPRSFFHLLMPYNSKMRPHLPTFRSWSPLPPRLISRPSLTVLCLTALKIMLKWRIYIQTDGLESS